MTMYQEGVTIWISGLPEDDSPSPMWVVIFQSFEDLNRTKRQGRVNLLELWHPYSSAFGHWHSWFLAAGRRPGLVPLAPSFRPLHSDCIPTPTFLSFLLTDYRPWDSSISIIMGANFYNKSLHICIYPIGSVSLGNPNTHHHTHFELATSAPCMGPGTEPALNSHLFHERLYSPGSQSSGQTLQWMYFDFSKNNSYWLSSSLQLLTEYIS